MSIKRMLTEQAALNQKIADDLAKSGQTHTAQTGAAVVHKKPADIVVSKEKSAPAAKKSTKKGA